MTRIMQLVKVCVQNERKQTVGFYGSKRGFAHRKSQPDVRSWVLVLRWSHTNHEHKSVNEHWI
jgi:hypothetical protein